MLHAWLLCPVFMFIVLFRNRKNIGIKTKTTEETTKPGEEGAKDQTGKAVTDKNLKRDPMKVKWLRDYARSQLLQL